MEFYMPVRVYEEEECVINHAADLSALGSKALIVTGRHSAKANGSLGDVLEALKSHGTAFALFDKVEENPSIETVMEGRDVGAGAGCDFVIGIGGGSALDAAKAISLMMKHAGEDASYLYNKTVPSDTFPIAAVPTTCGTGSEVTGVSVLTINAKKTKGSIPHKIFPALALIDGKYLKAAPVSVIHNTAVDALAHLWESALSRKATEYSRMCVHAGLLRWRENIPVLLGKKEPDAGDFASLMRASAFGGMAIAQTGTSIPHALSYSITYDIHMPHGMACGYFEAGFLAAADADMREYLLGAAGFSGLKEWEKFYDTVCAGLRPDEKEVEHSVEMVLANPAKLKSAAFPVDEKVLREIAERNLR